MPIPFRLLGARLALTGRFVLVCLILGLYLGYPGRAVAQPVVEVAAFDVTPSLMARQSAGRRQGGETPARPAVRAVRHDTWPALLGRLLDTSFSIRGPVDQLPPLLPGRYVRQVSARLPHEVTVEYLVDERQAYLLAFRRDGVDVVSRLPGVDLISAARQDEMKGSLFVATDAVGLPESIALQLVDIFAEEIDFLRDLHQGYRCALVYEMNYEDGMPRPGRILAAEISHAGKRFAAYFHDLGNGEAGYFDTTGMDVNRTLRPATASQAQGKGRKVDPRMSFRRSPLEFSRVTSAPARLRYHPILKEWRSHRGTDYGAPEGTRVMATADGDVVYAGVRGGYGNLVILRHYDRFTTYYAHLKDFAPQLREGRRVRKGEIVGFVGMTGLATGPHLHYELRDEAVPGTLHIPLVVRTIPDAAVPEFLSSMATLRKQLDYAYRANMVVLE